MPLRWQLPLSDKRLALILKSYHEIVELILEIRPLSTEEDGFGVTDEPILRTGRKRGIIKCKEQLEQNKFSVSTYLLVGRFVSVLLDETV